MMARSVPFATQVVIVNSNFILVIGMCNIETTIVESIDKTVGVVLLFGCLVGTLIFFCFPFDNEAQNER